MGKFARSSSNAKPVLPGGTALKEIITMAKAKTAPTSSPRDAIALLKADHRFVEALFEAFEATKSAAKKVKIANEICLELCVHTMIEEEIFYPGVKGDVEEDILDEAYVEHDGAKMLIAEIMASAPDDQFYDAKVKVLSEEIKHHVKEEEQRGGMFAQAKAAGVDLVELGGRMAARKQELKTEYKTNGIPTPATRSMKGARLKVSQPVA